MEYVEQITKSDHDPSFHIQYASSLLVAMTGQHKSWGKFGVVGSSRIANSTSVGLLLLQLLAINLPPAYGNPVHETVIKSSNS